MTAIPAYEVPGLRREDWVGLFLMRYVSAVVQRDIETGRDAPISRQVQLHHDVLRDGIVILNRLHPGDFRAVGFNDAGALPSWFSFAVGCHEALLRGEEHILPAREALLGHEWERCWAWAMFSTDDLERIGAHAVRRAAAKRHVRDHMCEQGDALGLAFAALADDPLEALFVKDGAITALPDVIRDRISRLLHGSRRLPTSEVSESSLTDAHHPEGCGWDEFAADEEWELFLAYRDQRLADSSGLTRAKRIALEEFEQRHSGEPWAQIAKRGMVKSCVRESV